MSECTTTHVVISGNVLAKVRELLIKERDEHIIELNNLFLKEVQDACVKHNQSFWNKLFKKQIKLPTTVEELQSINAFPGITKDHALSLSARKYYMNRVINRLGDLVDCLRPGESVSVGLELVREISHLVKQVHDAESKSKES